MVPLTDHLRERSRVVNGAPLLAALLFSLAPPVGAAYICCDGKGDFRVCLQSADAIGAGELEEVSRQCLMRHERQHVVDLRRLAPRVCEGAPRFAVVAAGGDLLAHLECRGYREQIGCLRSAARSSRTWEEGEVLRAEADKLEAAARARFGCKRRRGGRGRLGTGRGEKPPVPPTPVGLDTRRGVFLR